MGSLAVVSAGLEGEGGAISVTTNTSCAARFNAAAFHRLQPLAGYGGGGSEDTDGRWEGERKEEKQKEVFTRAKEEKISV